MTTLLPASGSRTRMIAYFSRRALAALLNFSAALSLASAQSVKTNQPGAESGRGKTQSPGRRLGAGLTFIENRGQFDAHVKFQAKSGGNVVWFTSSGLVFDVLRPVAGSQPPIGPLSAAAQRPGGTFERLVFSEDFANGKESPKIEAASAQPGVYNYFIGSDPAKWRTHVVGYSQILYCDVWPGIDVRFVVNGGDMEQEFLVHPGADPSRIRVAYRGAAGLQVAKDGSLIVQTSFGPLREGTPRIYQEDRGRRTSVRGSYRISGNLAYAFQLGSYRKANPLVIDPTLLFSTYLGGPGSDYGMGIAVDPAGNTYIAGNTAFGSGYPTSAGVLQPSCPNSSNCSSSYSGIVSKLDALGRLSYSTYLGSSTGGDNARGIAVDASGEAYISGLAQSGFPTTSSAFQSNCNGSSFVAKLNSTGTALLYSTCLGDDGAENTIYYGVGGANGIAVDSSGRAYVAGDTESAFPTTPGALQSILAGTVNAFVAVIDPSLSGGASLAYSTLLGGEAQDYARAISVDAYGSAYITGDTISSHFPITANAFQQINKQGLCGDSLCPTGFFAKVNPSVSGSGGLIYSSYLGGGGSGGDFGYAIAVDSSGNAYIGGTTNSSNFPTTMGAFLTSDSQASCGAGFVTKVNAGGSALVYSTFLGPGLPSGPCATGVSGIAVDRSNDAYVVGATRSTSFPVTPNAFQSTNHGGPILGYDAFLTELAASGSSLMYSSYLGGSGEDSASAVAVDAVGDVYLTGNTASPNFPVTPFAYQPTISGSPTACQYNTFCPDVFVMKFPLGAPGGLSITGIIPNFGGDAGTVSPQVVGTGFHLGATTQLNCSPSIAGTNVTVGTGGRLLNTTFDLTSASPGACDVMVTNPDGTSAMLARAFTVQQGGAPNIQISLTGYVIHEGNEMVPAPHSATLFATVSNLGEIDSPAGVLTVPIDSFNPPFTGISATPPDLVPQPSDSEIWPSGPTPAHGFAPFSTTAGTLTLEPACAESKIGACYYPDNAINSGVFLGCIYSPGTYQSLGIPAACADPILASPFCLILAPGGLGAVLSCLAGFFVKALAACEIYGSNPWPAIPYCLNAATTPGLPICYYTNVPCYSLSDPNNLAGPPGVGGQQWTAGAQALTYGISFGNEPTATAPVQQVVVTQPLGSNVSLSTLTLPDITIPNGASSVQVTVPRGAFSPAAGANEFTTSVDLRPAQSLLVTVDATLNAAAQTLTWTLTSIDPATGMPPLSPLIGFLPAGAVANVAVSVTPTPGLTTGTQITQQAVIVFDANPSMSTGAWVNTIDNTPPVSHVSTLPAASTCPAFGVSWSGSDLGSGLQGFTIFVSDTGGPFSAWLSNTTAASADYIGTVGHTYSFYSIATDLTGNIEGAKTTAEASTSVTATSPCGTPSLSGQISNVAQSGTTVTATLTLTNAGFTAAQAVNISQMTFRTLSGSGTVTLASPTVPVAEGPLAIGASTTVPVTLNVPATVNRFSMTESGNLQDGSGNNYNYSIAQTVIP